MNTSSTISLIFGLLSLASTSTHAAPRLLVVNKSDDTVSILAIHNGKTLAILPTGIGPHEIATAKDGRRAAVTNYGRQTAGNSLTVLNLAKSAVERTIDLGMHKRPHGIAFLPDSKRVIVTTEDSRSVLIVDVTQGRIEIVISTNQDVSHMVALSPDGQRAYVANIGSGSLTAIDLATGQLLKQIATGNGAEGLAVTVDGTEVWVSNREADTLSVVDTATLSVKTTIPAKGFPIRVAMARDGRQALVTCAKAGELAVFDVKTKRELQQIKLDQNEGFFSPQFGLDSFPVGVIADSHRIFVASTGARRIAIVDPKLWTVSGYWPVGEEPDGMAIAP